MPEKLMELLEQLRMVSMENPGFWYSVNFWDNGTFDVFFVNGSKYLPNGNEVGFKFCENIQTWEKIVTVNGVRYMAFITQEEHDKEVAK